jgi:hypothetical protein
MIPFPAHAQEVLELTTSVEMQLIGQIFSTSRDLTRFLLISATAELAHEQPKFVT